MKVGCMLLALSLLAGVAADKPQPGREIIEVLNVAKGYQPEGCARSQVTFNKTGNIAYVRYLAGRDGRDVALSVLTLKKSDKGWLVESCAR